MSEYKLSSILCFDISDTGHRLNYLKFFSEKLRASYIFGPIYLNLYYIILSKWVFFTTYESAPARFTAIATIRSLFFRRTTLLVLRPSIQGDGWRAKAKRFAHKFLAHLPGTQVIVVTPLDQTSPLQGRSTFIFDPEFWDIDDISASRCQTELSERVLEHASGRSILVCTGMFSADKGMEQLLRMMRHADWPSRDIAVAITGQFAPNMTATRDQLTAHGAYVENRFLSDEELFSMYSAGHAVWACYAPTRDMSSGLVGRAIQFGVLPIVREGSVLTQILGKPSNYLALPWDDADAGCAKFHEINHIIKSYDVDLIINKFEQERILSSLFD